MDEKTIKMERVYDGRIVSLELHEVELHTGVRAQREIVRHGPAVAVVAELPDGRFAFVRQFRKPVEGVLLEVVAGNVEAGEALETAAVREVREETGYETASIRRLGAIYPSPGYVDERIEIFYATLAGVVADKDLDDDEHVEVQLHTRDEVHEMIETEVIQDGKTLAAWLLYDRLIRNASSEKTS